MFSLRESASVALCISMLGVATQGQTMPLALAEGGGGSSFTLWAYDENTTAVSQSLQGVEFLSVDLAGYAPVDRLRLDRPGLTDENGAALYVRLPGGGSLYRVGINGGTGLLVLRPDGSWSLPLVVPDGADGTEGMLETLHVSTDGTLALVATDLSQGGDVLVVDLTMGVAPVVLTSALPSLDVDDDSLRVSPGGAWFVADDVLMRADLSAASNAAPVDFSSLGLPGVPVQPELALAPFEDVVALIVGDDSAAWQIVTVPAVGLPSLITDTPSNYDLPTYDHDLGPWLALSPDGSMVAYRKVIGTSIELYVREVDASLPEMHLTAAPVFPAYLDIVGVLAFNFDRILCFFSGDLTLSGLQSADTIGAGEMYAADLTSPGQVTFHNVSLTNGQSVAPFTALSTLYFSEVVYDPTGMNFLMSGPLPDEQELLSTFRVYPVQSGSGVSTLLSGIEQQPDLISVGDQVLVTSKPDEDLLPPPSSGSSADVDLDVSLLVPGTGSNLALNSLLSVPDGIDLDRYTLHRDGTWLAMVATVDVGFEVPVLLHVASGMPLLPTWPLVSEVAPAIAFSSSGNLYVGLGAVNGPYKFAGLPTDGTVPFIVPLPMAFGFPLAH